MPDTEGLLEEIREFYDQDVLEWQEIRDAGDADMLMIADGPWPKDEILARADKDNPRPCESFDELGQYLNQTIGDMRQNKRAVKVTATGNGATDETALKQAGMIRQIEYDSNAQTGYQTAAENMFKRGYGFLKLGSRYADPAGGFEQELFIGAVSNPNTILVDPFAKQPDWSDMGHGFELDSFSNKEFLRKWPHAEIRSFEANEMKIAEAWLKDERIQVAAYWRLEKKQRTQVQIDMGDGPVDIYVDEIPGAKVKGNQLVVGGRAVQLLKKRTCEEPSVCQYITNGLEILETNPQKWIEIPIIPFFGPEEFVDAGSGSKRRLLSMVRKARGAYMGYCYARTKEIEVLGMPAMTLLGGYEGQFETKTPWNKINKVGLPYFEVKAVTTATGSAILPIPQRQLFDAPIQACEMAAASFRMAIQSAMSISGMLNGQRSQNADAKSGKAIEALDRQESQGTFVFVSNYERGLARVGRMLQQGLGWCYDSPREVGLRDAADKPSVEKINQVDEQGNKYGFHTSTGDHATTISVGPSDDSTRDAADDFVESIMNIPGIPPKIMGLAVRLKNLGPIGDEIANVFDPPEGGPQIPPQLQMQMQGLSQENNDLKFKLAAKIPDIQSKERMHAMDLDFKREQLAVEASIGAAKIGSAQAIERLDIETALIAKERGTAQDNAASLQAQHLDNAHEAGMAAAEHHRSMEAQASDQAHQRATAQAGQAHDSAMQGSQQVHQSGLQADAQQAAADAAAAEPEAA